MPVRVRGRGGDEKQMLGFDEVPEIVVDHRVDLGHDAELTPPSASLPLAEGASRRWNARSIKVRPGDETETGPPKAPKKRAPQTPSSSASKVRPKALVKRAVFAVTARR